MMTIEDVIETFDFLDDWEDRYKHIIDLGRNLPEFSEIYQTEENRVHGCTSRVWLIHSQENGYLSFKGDSDAFIVKGLVAIILMIYSRKTAKEILATDVSVYLSQLGLEKHLSPMRTNGLYSMVERIKNIAQNY
jgi:cysteine desulfuration protein SufE